MIVDIIQVVLTVSLLVLAGCFVMLWKNNLTLAIQLRRNAEVHAFNRGEIYAGRTIVDYDQFKRPYGRVLWNLLAWTYARAYPRSVAEEVAAWRASTLLQEVSRAP